VDAGWNHWLPTALQDILAALDASETRRRKAFEALDKATQDAVMKAGADAERRGWKISEEKNDFYKKALAEKGIAELVVLQKTSRQTHVHAGA
jgi:TRAP-type C4-dicarboxylate transport system substrate-binding protein